MDEQLVVMRVCLDKNETRATSAHLAPIVAGGLGGADEDDILAVGCLRWNTDK